MKYTNRFMISFGFCFALLVPSVVFSQSDPVLDYVQAAESGQAMAIATTSQTILNSNPERLDLEPDQYYELLIDIGDTRLEIESVRGAIIAYENALAFGEETYGSQAFELRKVLLPLAEAEANRENVDRAEQLILRSMEIAEAELGQDNPVIIEELELLLALSSNKGVPDDSVRLRLANLQEKIQVQRGEVTAMGGESREVDICSDDAVAQNAHQRIEVLYGTNRKRSGRTAAAKFYKDDYDEGAPVKYGSAFVSVPCKRDLGTIPAKKWWKAEFRSNPTKHMILQDVVEISDTDAFWDRVAKKTDENEVLVFIHGFAVPFAGAALRTAQLATDLELDGAPLFYDWPSRGNKAKYGDDRDLATGPVIPADLAAFLYDVEQRSGAKRISVVAHSMGNEVLLRALEDLAEGEYKNENKTPFDEVIFASPDVYVENFKSFVKDTQHLAGRVTLYASSVDKAMWISRWFKTGRLRAGDAKARVIMPGMDSVDTTLASGNFIGHDDFAGSGLNDLRAVVWHSLPTTSRCVLDEGSGKSNGIWIFKPKCDERIFRGAIVTLRRQGRAGALAWADLEIETAVLQGQPELESDWRAVKAELEEIMND